MDVCIIPNPLSRWLSVHIRDIMSLPVNHPNIHVEFRARKIVVHKTSSTFSAMAIDQCNEQDKDWAVGLTENHTALRRLTVAVPEVAAFEEDQVAEGSATKKIGRICTMKATWIAICCRKDDIQDMGNPF